MRMRDVVRRVAALLLVCVLPLACIGTAAAQGKRVALVVGNSAYRSVTPLGNPSNDARLIARTLASLGFTLIGGGARIDLDKAGFDQAVRTFGQALPGSEVALFYYAGHGLQVDGVNYLVPVDANPTRLQDLDFQMIDANVVLHQMEGSGTRLNLVVLDACRNNPFGGRGLARAAAGGLAQMRAPEGTLISYATQPGNVASDGSGADSPFSSALAEVMREPGLDVFRTFNEVGLAVKRATGGQQQPWVSSSPIDGDFYFAGVASAPVASVPVASLSPGSPRSGNFGIGKFYLGMSSLETNSLLEKPFGNASWEHLPVAGEYHNDEVRYFWIPWMKDASVTGFFTGNGCMSDNSYITFLFAKDSLFRISFRLYKGDGCKDYSAISQKLRALVGAEQGQEGHVRVFEDTNYAYVEILDSTKTTPDIPR
jgi:hypothetical protein